MVRAQFLKASAEERQAVVNEAQLLLELDACQQYGLVIGVPEIKLDRCLEVLELGREHGIIPTGNSTTL